MQKRPFRELWNKGEDPHTTINVAHLHHAAPNTRASSLQKWNLPCYSGELPWYFTPPSNHTIHRYY